MKKKFVVDTNIQYLYHLNSKNPPYKTKMIKPNESIPDPLPMTNVDKVDIELPKQKKSQS